MRFTSARLAVAAALAGIVCLVTSPVAAKSKLKADHASRGERNLQHATGDKAQALWSQRHHHHTNSCKHHKNSNHCTKNHKHNRHCNSPCKKNHKHNKNCNRPKHNCNKGASYIGLVCDGVVIDQLTCSNTLDAAVADIDALNNGGSKNYRYVVMQSPCSPTLPDGCQPVPEPVPLVDSENDIGADAEIDGVSAESADDAVSSPEEMPAGLPADQIALWKKKHHR
ncbi:hypothetical protein DFQ26_008407, partial [Actinomortierella ambigua]